MCMYRDYGNKHITKRYTRAEHIPSLAVSAHRHVAVVVISCRPGVGEDGRPSLLLSPSVVAPKPDVDDEAGEGDVVAVDVGVLLVVRPVVFARHAVARPHRRRHDGAAAGPVAARQRVAAQRRRGEHAEEGGPERQQRHRHLYLHVAPRRRAPGRPRRLHRRHCWGHDDGWIATLAPSHQLLSPLAAQFVDAGRSHSNDNGRRA